MTQFSRSPELIQNFAHRVAILTLELGGAPGKAQLRTLLDVSKPSNNVDQLPLRRQADEKAHVERILEECGGSYDEAAARLGISRSTLWRRLKAKREAVTAKLKTLMTGTRWAAPSPHRSTPGETAARLDCSGVHLQKSAVASF